MVMFVHRGVLGSDVTGVLQSWLAKKSTTQKEK